MPLLPRSRHGTWLLAGAVWVAVCAGLWWVLPVAPRAEILGTEGRVRFTADGEKLVGHDFPPLRVWDVRSGRQSLSWSTPEGRVQLSRPEIGLIIVSTGDAGDSRITLFDSETGRTEDVTWWTSPSRNEIFRTSDESYFVIAHSFDRGVKTVWWDRRAGKTVAEFARIMPLAVAPDGRWATIGKTSAEISLRAPASLVEQLCYCPGGGWWKVSFSQDGKYLVIHGELTEIIDLATGQLRVRISAEWPIVLSDIRQAVAVEYRHGATALLRWNVESGASLGKQIVAVFPAEDVIERPFPLLEHGKFAIRLRDSRPESLLERTIGRIPFFKPYLNDHSAIDVVYDARTGGELMRIQPRRNAAVQLTPDGGTLAVFASDDRVQLWDIPPRKSRTWFAAGGALLALPIALLARRRVRKLRAS